VPRQAYQSVLCAGIGEFYPTLDQVIVEDCFRQAIQKYGVPESVFFDNGSQYRTKWMNRACAKMGIRLIFAKPYSPEATGKVEKFNRTVDAFLSEAALEKPQTLDKLNQLFWVWLEECYQNKLHSAAETSRLLTAAAKQNEQRKAQQTPAVSYRIVISTNCLRRRSPGIFPPTNSTSPS